MKKSFYTLALLFVASIIFTSCRNGDDDNGNNNPPGIGNPTATTDPGVLIGEIDGERIRWATRNVNTPGTFAAYAHSAGRLFQWGTYNGVVHHWDNTTEAAPADFNTSRNRVAWTAANDPCPTGWRVPTIAELTALRDAGYSDFMQHNGVYGRFFGTAPNRIFLPVSGWRVGDSGALGGVGVSGGFWSSAGSDSENALSLWFGSGRVLVASWYWRSGAYSVRCVAE